MKIRFLGTAAAEAFPAMFCDCENCKKTQNLGGKNIRTRSQTLINSDMLIDYPCDTYFHIVNNGINLLDIKYCLITHIHQDHFYPQDFSWLKRGYSHPPVNWHGITVYGSNDIKESLDEIADNSNGFLRCETKCAFQPFDIGEYTVIALKAVHGTTNPYIYIIQNNGKSLLYAHDTGMFCDETWQYLKNSGIYFDAVSMDCTEGTTEITYDSHMDLNTNIKVREMMLKYNLANEKTVFVLNHFSHNGGNSVYDEFFEIAKTNGFITAFDGLEIEI